MSRTVPVNRLVGTNETSQSPKMRIYSFFELRKNRRIQRTWVAWFASRRRRHDGILRGRAGALAETKGEAIRVGICKRIARRALQINAWKSRKPKFTTS